MNKSVVMASMVAMFASGVAGAADYTVTVNTKDAKNITPVTYGFHYEEIGMIGEGGLYAELVRNRGFEEANLPKGFVFEGEFKSRPSGLNKQMYLEDPLIGWITTPLTCSNIRMERTVRNPLNEQNPHSMAVTVVDIYGDQFKGSAIHNTGFYGMNFKKGVPLNLSLYMLPLRYKGDLLVRLSDADGKPVSPSVRITPDSKEWKKYEAVLTPDKDEPRGMLTIEPTSPGSFQLDMVSMFPSDTWDNGKSVFRKDIMVNIAEYAPEFIRFPGGCIIHGANEETSYHWKETIGDIAKRPGAWSKWKPNFRSDGLGYHEFYELCEYLGADAMYVTSVGMFCSEFVKKAPGHHKFHHQETDVNKYIADVLDAIEYAIGDVDTRWGAERAKNGHPAPFPLKYVEIGNEDFGPVYYEKYHAMYNAIKEKYPQLKLIANSIIFEDEPDKQKYIEDFVSKDEIEIYDEHYYHKVDWAIDNAYKFDSYKRQGIDLFIGELGISGPYPKGMLGEAILKMNLEANGDLNPIMADRPMMRNYDFVAGSRIQPVLMHTSDRSYKTFNYYLCKMLRDNKVKKVYGTTVSSDKDIFATAGLSESGKEIIVKLVNITDHEASVALDLKGISGKKKAEVTTLTADKTQIVTPANPDAVAPVIVDDDIKLPELNVKLPANSFVIYRIKK